MAKAKSYSRSERFRHTALRTFHRAVKKAKVFEVKKAMRRCKEQPSEERAKRVEKLKALEVERLASIALSRFLEEDGEKVDDASSIVLSAGPVKAANSLLSDKRRLKRKLPASAVVEPDPVEERRDSAFLSSLSSTKKKPKKKAAEKHLKKEEPEVKKKPPVSRKKQRPARPGGSSSQINNDDAHLHASWAAARAKKQESVVVPFQGTKVTFS